MAKSRVGPSRIPRAVLYATPAFFDAEAVLLVLDLFLKLFPSGFNVVSPTRGFVEA